MFVNNNLYNIYPINKPKKLIYIFDLDITLSIESKGNYSEEIVDIDFIIDDNILIKGYKTKDCKINKKLKIYHHIEIEYDNKKILYSTDFTNNESFIGIDQNNFLYYIDKQYLFIIPFLNKKYDFNKIYHRYLRSDDYVLMYPNKVYESQSYYFASLNINL